MNDEAAKAAPEKMPLTSMDIAQEKREQFGRCLAAAFPEIMAEDKIDFDQLKRVLGEWVEPDRERFGLNWPGKAACMKVIQAPSVGTLKPCREESVDWDTTQNLFIEGDNLEVLKLLQKAYFGKIKMIYIDPPYNTGKEFIYPDKYAETLDTYLEYTGQKDSEGRKFSTNTDASGRFHSRWLNMMYPRLYLAKNLLRNDGVIFISIDDNEQANLKLLCDIVFGEENFISQMIWNSEGNTDNQLQVKINHQNVLLYIRDRTKIDEAIGYVIDPNTREDSNLHKGFADNNITKNGSANPPQIIELPPGFSCTENFLHLPAEILDEEFFRITLREKFISGYIKERYKIRSLPVRLDEMLIKDGKLVNKCRVYSGYANADKLKQYILSGLTPIEEEGGSVHFYLNRNGCVRYRKERSKARNILSVIRNVGTTERARSELGRIGILYDYPKPVDLLKYLIRIGAPGSVPIVMDFFCGSGTTGQSVMDVNIEDQTDRRFILVQLPEPLKQSLDINQKGWEDEADIANARLRRIAEGHKKNGELTVRDVGFRVFKLDHSCFKAWHGDVDDLNDNTLLELIESHGEHVDSSVSAADILFELLLKDGFPLTVPMQRLEVAGKEVFSIADGALLICLERELTQELMDALAEMEPSRVICLDAGFQGNDQLKANSVQTFKARARNKETAIEFRTV